MLATNTTVLEGGAITPGELMAHATAAPFLAAHRLVVVEGLLQAIGGVRRGGRAKKKPGADDPLEAWRACAGQLADAERMPPTTTLVFVEGALGKGNAAFTIFAPIAQTVEYTPLSETELVAWVRNRAKRTKLKLTEGAAVVLVSLAGADMWTLVNELEKLAAYAGDEPVSEGTVRDLVSAAHETKFWEVADAVIAGNEGRALTSLRRLLIDGVAPQVIASMIVRQYRQLLLVKDMRDRRVGREEMLRLSGVPSFRLSDVHALAGKYSWPVLLQAYRALLDSDLSVKRGLQDDESALQLAIHELCAMRPAGGGRPEAMRR